MFHFQQKNFQGNISDHGFFIYINFDVGQNNPRENDCEDVKNCKMLRVESFQWN